jgi:hypothetical protein
METIEIYYRFVVNSLLHGQFLVDMYALDPKAKMTLSYDHEYVANTQTFSVTMLSQVAILQKLKYGDCLAGSKRPPPPPKEETEKDYKYFKKKMFEMEEQKYIDSSYWITEKLIEIEKLKDIKNFHMLKARKSNNNIKYKIDFYSPLDDDSL